MPDRVDVNESDVFDAVLSRLRQSLGLNERQCFYVLNDRYGLPRIPLGVIGENYYVTVAPGESSFDDGLVAGHPIAQVTEYATVQVTGVTRVALDETDHDEQILKHAERGLWKIKRDILVALSGQDFALDNGNNFLRELCRPIAVSKPDVGLIDDADEGLPVAFVTVTFAVPFDHDLDDEAEEEDSSGSSESSSSST